VWQWYNFVTTDIPAGKTLLRVNIDETSVCFWQGSAKGTVLLKKSRYARELAPVQPVSRTEQRTYLTHVACVCDRPDLQPRMPQFIIVNAKSIKVIDTSLCNVDAPPNVFVIRAKSAWNNTFLLMQLLLCLTKLLGPELMATLYVVLFLDASRLHLPPCIVRFCNAHGWRYLLIPAKLTWFLQVLDTHAFRFYKQLLRTLYISTRGASPTGSVTISAFIHLLFTVILRVLQGKRWSGAFDKNGFSTRQLETSKFILQHLELQNTPCISCAQPSLEQLRLIFPKNCQIPYRAIFPKAKAMLALPPAHLPAPMHPLPAPLRPRVLFALPPPPVPPPPTTRSMAKAAARPQLSQAAASSSAVPRAKPFFPRRRPP